MKIRKALSKDFESAIYIYSEARHFMANTGNPEQWGTTYPERETVCNDLESGNLYICVEGEKVLGVFCFFIGIEPTYSAIYNGGWLNDAEYGVIHRVAVAPDAHGQGVVEYCFNYCFDKISNIKIDTHENNYPMQRALLKYGFERCGTVTVSNGERIAFQKSVSGHNGSYA